MAFVFLVRHEHGMIVLSVLSNKYFIAEPVIEILSNAPKGVDLTLAGGHIYYATTDFVMIFNTKYYA